MKTRLLIYACAAAVGASCGCSRLGQSTGDADRAEERQTAPWQATAKPGESATGMSRLATTQVSYPAAEPSRAAAVVEEIRLGRVAAPTPAVPEHALVAARRSLGSVPSVEVTILGVTDATPARREPPAGANEAEGRVCTVSIEAADSQATEHALLYSYYTANIPDELKRLSPELLERHFDVTRLGTFSGPRGALSGMKKFSHTLPDEVVLHMPEGARLDGPIGVRAQLWRCADGRWEPDAEIVEQTVTLQ
ncbi:MAG: hypothetical protein ACYTG0_12820 [Planctomycetota bacterium]|jgi:hypothetical protein